MAASQRLKPSAPMHMNLRIRPSISVLGLIWSMFMDRTLSRNPPPKRVIGSCTENAGCNHPARQMLPHPKLIPKDTDLSI